MTDLERDPSTNGTSSMNASSLNESPDSHSVVERLLHQTALDLTDTDAVRDYLNSDSLLHHEAAIIIEELLARVSDLETDLGNSNYSNHLIDDEMDEWKARAGRLQSELDTANSNHRSMARQLAETGIRLQHAESSVAELQAVVKRLTGNPADQRYWEGRYRDAQSSLDRVRAETVELLATLDERMDAAHRDAIESSKEDCNSYGAGYDMGYFDALMVARSLTKTGGMDSGEVKNAESEHSPSTLNAETE